MRISFAQLLGRHDQSTLDLAVLRFRQHYLEQGIHHYRVYPGIIALLDQLIQQALTLHVLTAKPRNQAQWLLADAGLSRYFQQVYGSEDQGVRRGSRAARRQLRCIDQDPSRVTTAAAEGYA